VWDRQLHGGGGAHRPPHAWHRPVTAYDRPEMYLDPRVRAGISTFAALADAAEVEAGCRKLSRDIAMGRIADVVASYQHAQGDYLFVLGEKEGP
jgi:hypothetical protein